jgi:hypothetical protein
MPYFNYDGDISVDPDDYIDNCSEDEIEELIQYLVNKKHLPPSIIEGKYISTQTQSVLEEEFGKTMSKIVSNRLQLTNEEDEILRKIASRF